MTEDRKEIIKVRVEEGEPGDVNRHVIRLNSKLMKKLNLQAGDVIKIKGKSETAALILRAKLEDEDKEIIRMDGIIRSNSGVKLGDKVEVEKAKVSAATSLTLAPIDAGLKFSGDPSSWFRERLIDKPLMKGDKISMGLLGTTIHFLVTSLSPKGVTIITYDTKVKVSETPVKATEKSKLPTVTYEDIGGLDEPIAKIREMVELPLKHPEVFERLGVGAPKGVLLHGPPGCGKTLLAKAVANESDANFISIAGPEVVSKWYGDSEKRLRDLFEQAEKNAPTIIFIDEIDAIAPKRGEVTGEVERRMVSQLLTLMDGLSARGEVIVIAATNRPNALDEALRRPGRFDREVEIPMPTKKGRREMVQIHTRGMPLAGDVDMDKLASITHGYTGADISALTKEAAMKALRKKLPEIKKVEGRVPTAVLSNLHVTMGDFKAAFNEISPSAMREVLIETPNTRWIDIGGLEPIKDELKEAVEWPLKYPGAFKKLGIQPSKGILLYGPAGCGKTLLAKAVAGESEANFISVKGPELISKWVGESEKGVRKIFHRARQVAPCIIFFDEFDSIAQMRGTAGDSKVGGRVVDQLLTELDGMQNLDGVMVIAATNRPDLLDQGLMRAGRFDKKVMIPKPDEKARAEIFKVHTKNMPLGKGANFKEYVKKTEGYTGADVALICREAGMFAMRKNKRAKEVTKEDFDKAFKKVVKDAESEKGADMMLR